MDSDEHDEVLERARQLVEKQKPKASGQHKAAFCNSVAYLVTGWSGGYGGPSVREHAASWLYAGKRYSFDDAVDLLIQDDGVIFGPISKVHRQCWNEEHCFDDDPVDVNELES
jgi:hypothetical protein